MKMKYIIISASLLLVSSVAHAGKKLIVNRLDYDVVAEVTPQAGPKKTVDVKRGNEASISYDGDQLIAFKVYKKTSSGTGAELLKIQAGSDYYYGQWLNTNNTFLVYVHADLYTKEESIIGLAGNDAKNMKKNYKNAKPCGEARQNAYRYC